MLITKFVIESGKISSRTQLSTEVMDPDCRELARQNLAQAAASPVAVAVAGENDYVISVGLGMPPVAWEKLAAEEEILEDEILELQNTITEMTPILRAAGFHLHYHQSDAVYMVIPPDATALPDVLTGLITVSVAKAKFKEISSDDPSPEEIADWEEQIGLVSMEVFEARPALVAFQSSWGAEWVEWDEYADCFAAAMLEP